MGVGRRSFMRPIRYIPPLAAAEGQFAKILVVGYDNSLLVNGPGQNILIVRLR